MYFRKRLLSLLVCITMFMVLASPPALRSHAMPAHQAPATAPAASSALVPLPRSCGGGLPPGVVETMFSPFVQSGTDKSGMGLGLSICRRSVEAINGEVGVRDVRGRHVGEALLAGAAADQLDRLGLGVVERDVGVASLVARRPAGEHDDAVGDARLACARERSLDRGHVAVLPHVHRADG